MVQIIPEFRRPSLSDQFGEAFAGIGKTASEEIPRHFLRKQENKSLADLIGHDISDIQDPQMRQKFVDMALQRENQAAKLRGEYEADRESYEAIKKAFGEEYADIWLAMGQGERTALSQVALDAIRRGKGVKDLISSSEKKEPPTRSPQTNTIKTPSGEEFELPELGTPEEMTPADRIKYQGALRKENSPIFVEGKNKIKGLKAEQDRLGILEDLSPKIPGHVRFLVNKEGNISPWAQRLKLVPKSAERFVKTVNDFISSAKDIFGSRVTNYDIQVFKSRLPGLMNSKEGRKEIVQQMRIFNEIENNYHKAIDQVYKKYGLGNISQEQAEQLVEGIVGPREQQLRDELEKIGSQDFDLDEMPDASEHVGKVIEDNQGQKYRSNGVDWEPI